MRKPPRIVDTTHALSLLAERTTTSAYDRPKLASETQIESSGGYMYTRCVSSKEGKDGGGEGVVGNIAKQGLVHLRVLLIV